MLNARGISQRQAGKGGKLTAYLSPAGFTGELEDDAVRPVLADDLRRQLLQHLERELGVVVGQRVEGVRAQQRLQRLAEHRRIEHLALELDRPAEQRIGLDRRREDRAFARDVGRRGRVRDLAQVDVAGVDHLLAGEAHRGLLARVLVHDARFVVAVQVEPAADVVVLDVFFRHHRLADQRLDPADDALAGDARLEHHLVQEEPELLGPALGRDLDAHRLGEVVDPEHDVLHRRVLHDLGRDLERLRVLDDRLDGDRAIERRQEPRQIADLGRTVGFARLRQHDHVDVIGQVADQRHVLLVLVGAERVHPQRDLQVPAAQQPGQLAVQEITAHLLLPAAVLEVEDQRVGERVVRVLLEPLGRGVQVLVDAERGSVLDRRIVELDAGPEVREDGGADDLAELVGVRGRGEASPEQRVAKLIHPVLLLERRWPIMPQRTIVRTLAPVRPERQSPSGAAGGSGRPGFTGGARSAVIGGRGWARRGATPVSVRRENRTAQEPFPPGLTATRRFFAMASTIESVLQEDRAFPPSPEFVKQANVSGIAAYQALCDEAERDFEGFWGRLAKENVLWHKPFTRVLDESNAPFFKWFPDGELNASYDCLDRHLKTQGDKVAIIFEADDGKVTKVTYKQLHARVCKFANALKSLGVQKGDRVLVYLPMSIEAVVAMQACARIGATHSVVFGGFSAKSVQERIVDA